MKRYVFLVLFYLANSVLFAESITNMSFDDASQLASALKSEKYLLNYCDYCEKAPATFVKIQSLAVVASTQADMYSVKVVGVQVMRFEADENANFTKASSLNEPFEGFVSLNESMVNKYGRALPAGYFIDKTAEELQSVMDFVYYPNPNNTDIFASFAKDAEYAAYLEWYKSNVAPHLASRLFVGKFDVTNFCETASYCKGFPPGLNNISFNVEESGTVILIAGTTKEKATWKLVDGKILTTDKDNVTTVYGYRMEGNLMILRNFQYGLNPDKKESFRIMRLKRAK